jgi:hypothetical protein
VLVTGSRRSALIFLVYVSIKALRRMLQIVGSFIDTLYKGRNEIRHLTKLCSVTSLRRGELNTDSWRKRKRKLRVSDLFDGV